MCFPSHPMADNESLYDSLAYHRASIVGWRPCFFCRAVFSICFACRTFFIVEKVRVWLHNCFFFLITYPGIEVTSWLFWSSSVGLCEDFVFLPQEDLGVVHVGDQVLRLARVLKEGFLVLVVLELLDQLLDFVLTCCILQLDCRKRYSRYSVIHGVVYRFPSNFFESLYGSQDDLARLGFVDLANHIASSIWVQPVALLELSELFGRVLPVSSYIPLSQCKLQVVCCRERLHVTAFGKMANLCLGRASNCTKIQCFEGVFKYSCVARSLVSSSRVEFHPHHFHPPSDSL